MLSSLWELHLHAALHWCTSNSSQLLLKATDLDWVQVNPFSIEAVDNIHLLWHAPLKASTDYTTTILSISRYYEGTQDNIFMHYVTWDFGRFHEER